MANRGPGRLADPGGSDAWGGRKAQDYVRLTLDTYGSTCWLCGLPGSTTADHVIPRSKGGAVYDLANLGPAHRNCNEARGNRPAESYLVVESGFEFFSTK